MPRKLLIIVVFAFSGAHGAAQLNSNGVSAVVKNLRPENDVQKWTRIKKEVNGLLLLQRRAESVLVINREIEVLSEMIRPNEKANANLKQKLYSLKYLALTQFMSSKAQEAYETASTTLIADKRKSSRSLQVCLDLEPENLLCRWQELKFLKMYGSSEYQDRASVFTLTIENMTEFQLFQFSILPEGTKPALEKLNKLENLTYEDRILFFILSYRSAVLSKNFSKAKEMIINLESNAADYPDVIFMKYQLSVLSSESEKSADRVFEIYRKTCNNALPSTVRKYYFDIDFCSRKVI